MPYLLVLPTNYLPLKSPVATSRRNKRKTYVIFPMLISIDEKRKIEFVLFLTSILHILPELCNVSLYVLFRCYCFSKGTFW